MKGRAKGRPQETRNKVSRDGGSGRKPAAKVKRRLCNRGQEFERLQIRGSNIQSAL